MKFRIITALGVLTAITGFTSSAHAQQAIAYSSQRATNSSSAALAGIENRSVQNDSNKFFLGNSSTPTATNPDLPSANSTDITNTSIAQQTGTLQLSQNVQVITNDSQSSPLSVVPGRQNQPLPNVERVQVQLNP